MKYEPTENRVFVKRTGAADTTPGGIVIPEGAKEIPLEGEVIAKGPGKYLEGGDICPVNLDVGDMVIFGKYSGNEFSINGEEVLVLREDDIIAKCSK